MIGVSKDPAAGTTTFKLDVPGVTSTSSRLVFVLPTRDTTFEDLPDILEKFIAMAKAIGYSF